MELIYYEVKFHILEKETLYYSLKSYIIEL